MEKVNRYIICAEDTGPTEEIRTEHGDYVRYEDYEKLQVENAILLEYARHKEHCDTAVYGRCFPCSCGFSKAIKKVKE